MKQVFDVTKLDSPNTSQKEIDLSKPEFVLFRVSILISPITITFSYRSSAGLKDVDRSEKIVSMLAFGVGKNYK